LKQPVKSRLTLEDYKRGILEGDRIILGQAITLVESTRASDQVLASALLEKIMDKTGDSIRIGITGVPGVGKSSFIEAFGKHITAQGQKIAVLTVDPSSQLTKGSILGDKTRMESLAKDPSAFIRPSSSGNILGGVANRTREAMLLCEAAGYDVIIVETVGVGQSEVVIKNMVDFFLLLMLAGAGDELQGIKKGITEVADAIVITKADGDNISQATEAQADYQHALQLNSVAESSWHPKVLTISAFTGKGLADVWEMILEFRRQTTSSGFFTRNRAQQNIAWLHDYFQQLLRSDLQHPSLQKEIQTLEEKVSQQKQSPSSAALELREAYYRLIRGK
jgi:LAO/AO transport system kinase